jgi:predicted nucleic acid-binding protein
VRQLLDDALNGQHTIIVSPLVLAELIIIAEKQRAPLDLPKIMATLTAEPAFELVALSAQTALLTAQLSVLPDIHDRLIVATALEFGATLMTYDQAITRSGLTPVVA